MAKSTFIQDFCYLFKLPNFIEFHLISKREQLYANVRQGFIDFRNKMNVKLCFHSTTFVASVQLSVSFSVLLVLSFRTQPCSYQIRRHNFSDSDEIDERNILMNFRET